MVLLVRVVLFCGRRYGDGRNPRSRFSRGGVAPNGNFLRYFGWDEFSDPRRSRLLPSRPIRRPPREYHDPYPVTYLHAVESLVPVLIYSEPWLVVVLFSLASASTERYVVRCLFVECVEYILCISSVIHPNNNNDDDDDEDEDEDDDEEEDEDEDDEDDDWFLCCMVTYLKQNCTFFFFFIY